MNIIENLSPDRWEEYKNIKIASIENENLAFSESLDKLKGKTEEEWRKELETLDEEGGILLFVEDENSVIIGFAGAHVHKNSRLAHNAFLSNLYVKSEFRNLGLGKRLTEERTIVLKRKYPEVVNLHCEIVTTQVASVEIHKKMGFVITGEIKNLFKIDGEFYSEYWMQKEI